MGKGFGIAALVLAILSAFAVYGINFATIWVSMICCIVAALNGERPFSIASIAISAAGLLLFSPISLGVILVSMHRGEYGLSVIVFLPMVLAVGALVVDASRRQSATSTAT